MQGHSNETTISNLLLNPENDNCLISCASDTTIRFWDINTAAELKRILLRNPIYTACIW